MAASALCRALPGLDPADQSRHRFSFHSLPKLTVKQQRTTIFAAAEAGDGKKNTTGTQIFRFNKLKFGAKEEEEEDNEAESASTQPPIFQQLLKSFNGGGGTQIVPVLGTKKLGISVKKRDPKTVFVAGATGQIGARITQGLLRKGISVRGGVRDLFTAQQVAEFATQYGVISREEAKRLNAVEFEYKSVESIAKAIGAAAQVVVTIGPTEDGPRAKVSFEDASNVVEAAKLANVSNLVVIYEPGTGRSEDLSNPIAGITSFFSELFSKPVAISLSELLDKIVETDLPFTLLRTSPTDGTEDISPPSEVLDLRKLEVSMTSPLAKISKGQVASVIVEILSNPIVAENKVIEVFANNTPNAIQRPISEILSGIPVDGRRAALAEARAKAQEEERERAEREAAAAAARAAAAELKEATREAARLEAEAAKLAAEEVRLSSLAEKAQEQAQAAAAAAEGFASRIKQLAKGGGAEATTAKPVAIPNIFARPSSSSSTPPPSKSLRPNTTPPPKANKAKVPTKPSPKPSPPTPTFSNQPQTNTIFGGLFTQETVYVDD